MEPRTLNYPEVTEKGMDCAETVNYYSRLFSKGRFYYRRLAKKALGLKPDAKEIVDLGTGPGFLAIELNKLSGIKVKAVDLSPNMLAKARENAQKQNADIETVEGNALNLPLKDKSVDLLTATYLLHFIGDLDDFLNELVRVMRPGGKVMLLGFHRNVSPLIKNVLDFVSKAFIRYKPIHGLGPVLEASFTETEFINSAKRAGIDSCRVSTGLISMYITITF